MRADASPEIGTGHVMRCLALAQTWQDRDGTAVFLMAQSTPAIRERLNRENCEIISVDAIVGSVDDAGKTLEVARQCGCDWLVLDGYRFDATYEAGVRGHGFRVLCVDDLDDRRHCADVILNPNLTASKSEYEHRGSASELLLGTKYSLLRREFRSWRDWNREIPPVARKILVTLGGSTPEALALSILEALYQVKNQVERVIFVLGASSGESKPLKQAAAKMEGKISLVWCATDMATLMAEADVAIAAAGATCWELCFMGLPALIVDVAANQTAEAVELHRQACAKYLGSASALRPRRLAEELSELLRSHKLRQEVSQRCRTLVDGRGAERAVAAMQEYKPGVPVSVVEQETRA